MKREWQLKKLTKVQKEALINFDKKRCDWANTDPLNLAYHDLEWGVSVHEDKKLFEFLILEGAQAGLSWTTILRKRENYRKAFDSFNPKKIAQYGPDKIKLLLANEGIIRNRRKIAATIQNAGAFILVQKEFGSFDKYIRLFDNEKSMSKDLIQRGFKFVGPTICYSFMQAIGMVNDHQKDCFLYKKVN